MTRYGRKPPLRRGPLLNDDGEPVRCPRCAANPKGKGPRDGLPREAPDGIPWKYMCSGCGEVWSD